MKNLISGKMTQLIDESSQSEYKIPPVVLMEQAGLKAWQFIETKIEDDEPFVVVAGGGNNGGDALVIAREAINNGVTDILVILLGKHISESSQIQRDIIKSYGIPTVHIEDGIIDSQTLQAIDSAKYIVDGITGTGLSSPIRGDALKLIEAINNSDAEVFSVDIPSGLGDDVEVSSTSIKANYTICMGPLKSVYYNPTVHAKCGAVECVNPSFPPFLIKASKPSAYLADDEEPSLIPLDIDAYKKTRGHLAVFGGSKNFTGAVRLASRSAFVSRVGLVSCFVEPEIYPIIASESPSVIVQPTTEIDDIDSYTALLAGPGWGEGREMLLDSLLKTLKPLVIDADGIRAFANLYKSGKVVGHGTIVLTPHMGELRALAAAVCPEYEGKVGFSDRPSDFLNLLQNISIKTGAIIVCKASVTLIATAARKPIIVSGDNPALGVAGSGDVLAGCIAGLLAGGLSPYKSALYGVLWHKEAGLKAFKKNGYFDTETLIPLLGKVIAK
ncbi:MAG: NAD(P)H-hydrate dehydratase [Sphaerochaetaceae bacterium]|nr:NAD(P)H-hydrate dehydratase [Sphaerochaetaceae bacterium]